MPSSHDLRRLAKHRTDARQRCLQQAEAIDAQRVAMLDEASACRQGTDMRDIHVTAEHGLSRSDLFDRLRSMAVRQAHAIEVDLFAASLETSAARLVDDISQWHVQAVENDRKSRKLHALLTRKMDFRRRRTLRRTERDIEGDRSWTR